MIDKSMSEKDAFYKGKQFIKKYMPKLPFKD